MNCPACGADNPSDKRFCGDCGARLVPLCPSCGGRNPPDKKFCGDCGAALDAGAAPVDEAGDGAERRHLTVMFSDLAGSTAMSTPKTCAT